MYLILEDFVCEEAEVMLWKITVVNILPAYGAAYWMTCCGICSSLPET